MRFYGFGTLSALFSLRKMLKLFRKENLLLSLFADITGDVTDGLKKEVGTSVERKVSKLVSDIRRAQ
jgi:hypothetical protein